MADKVPKEPYYHEEPVIASAVRYHRKACPAVSLIERRNRRKLPSWREAQRYGLEPCNICKPFPHPRAFPHSPGTPPQEPHHSLESVVHPDFVLREWESIKRTVQEIAQRLSDRLGGQNQRLPRLLDELHQMNALPSHVFYMIHVVRSVRNRLAHPNPEAPVPDAEVLAATGCILALKQWAVANGFEM